MEFNVEKDIEYAKAVLNMNDSEISDFLEISRMTLSRWKKGTSIPAFDSLEKIYCKLYLSKIHLNRLKEEMYSSSLLPNHSLLFHGAKNELIGNPSILYSDGNKVWKRILFGRIFQSIGKFCHRI